MPQVVVTEAVQDEVDGRSLLDGAHLLPVVRTGVVFVDGV